jgi:hypothetical protein
MRRNRWENLYLFLDMLMMYEQVIKILTRRNKKKKEISWYHFVDTTTTYHFSVNIQKYTIKKIKERNISKEISKQKKTQLLQSFYQNSSNRS